MLSQLPAGYLYSTLERRGNEDSLTALPRPGSMGKSAEYIESIHSKTKHKLSSLFSAYP